MTAIRMTKAWQPADTASSQLKGHLGVFQLCNADEAVVYIGYAGGNSLFGLGGEVASALADHPDATGYRVEITSSYLSRYRELMMVHIADHGEVPQFNEPVKLGRLSPA